MKLKLAAFDFDGTIADTIPMCIKAFRMSVLPYIGYEIRETVQTIPETVRDMESDSCLY